MDMDYLSYDVIELEPNNIGGIRSKVDVIATILHICVVGSLKNHIIGKGNLSDSLTNHYLTILLDRNLLEAYVDGGNNRTYYKTTPKGKKMIYHYNEIQRLFASEKSIITQLAQRGPSHGENYESHIGKSVLIIDDEPDITSALKKGMEDYGFKVDVFNDPVTALSNYTNGSYELIILDVKIPGMSGFELYNLIRKLDSKTRICFWTAFDVCYEELRKRFPSLDEKFFIRKPITMSDLIGRIDNILHSSSTMNEGPDKS